MPNIWIKEWKSTHEVATRGGKPLYKLALENNSQIGKSQVFASDVSFQSSRLYI